MEDSDSSGLSEDFEESRREKRAHPEEETETASSIPIIKVFSCKYCQLSFTVKSNCTRHEKRCSSGHGSAQKEEFNCSNCGAKYNRKDNLSSHIKKCSSNNSK